MIDHVLGRPSVTFRKYQVLAVVAFWSTYLLRADKHGPPGIRRLSELVSKRLSTWQTLVITLLWLYVSRNFGKLVGLECPEPLANLYTRSYFRATWVTTALDAGFWSAMHIKRKWIRDFLSMAFSVYYLICAEQADEKVRKMRHVLTVDHLRVSWNKLTTPYLSAIAKLTRPRAMRYQPRAIRIARPSSSSYSAPVAGWLYFDGPLSALKRHKRIILNIPGGGFVAMNPRTHDDSLLTWAGKTGVPILSLDYKKAPEYPYPYALNECYDVYHMLIASKGRCVGLSGESQPQIVVSGDSAGGNLATSMVLMVLQSGATETRRWLGEEALSPPVSLVLIYPALDMNIGNWMTDEQMALIRDRKMRNTNRRVVRHKSNDFRRLAPKSPLPSDDEDDDDEEGDTHRLRFQSQTIDHPDQLPIVTNTSTTVKTRLATPSLLSYVNDRILTPEMMRAMIILYIGPHYRPDFSTEFLLSPVLAPESLLAHFPKTYFMTGERDPLVDDTVILAGRIRAVKAAQWEERKELGILARNERERFDDKEHVEVKLIEGISHGFLQFVGVFPEAWDHIDRIGGWYEESFANASRKEMQDRAASLMARKKRPNGHTRNHHRTATGGSSVDDAPLEMASLRFSKLSSGDQDNGKEKPVRSLHVKQGHENRSKNQTLDLDGVDRGVPELETAIAMDSSLPVPDYLARKHPLRGRRSSRGTKSLASEEDLLARRMNGLAGGLTRAREDEDVL